MSKYSITSTLVTETDQHNAKYEILVTSIVDPNGRVLQQYGVGSEWVEIRAPEDRGEMVGVCRDCHKGIWEHQEWEFSLKENWMAHMIEEDCVKEN